MHLTRPLHPLVEREWEKLAKCLRKSHRKESMSRLLAGEFPVLHKVGLDLSLNSSPT